MTTVRPRLPRRPVPPPARVTLLAQRLFTAAVIWVFMISIYRYKAWYIAAAVALAVTSTLVLVGRLRMRGVMSVVVPLGLYYGWLVTTALWAAHPRDSVWFGTADAIGIVVAALFFLLTLNQPERVSEVVINFAWVAVPVTMIIFQRDPEATRSGGYAISVLPFVPAFAWADVTRRHRPLLAGLALVVTFGLLIFARSRTPIVVAVFTLGLAVFAFSRGILALLRRTIAGAVVVALAFGVLVYLPSTRQVALTTFSRFTHMDVQVGDVYVESERRVDPVRVDLHRAARHYIAEHTLLGIGYANFPYYFANDWDPGGRPFTLHSCYETWWVEGGLVCVAIIFAIFWRQFRFLARCWRSFDPDVRRLARVVAIATLGIFVFGLFHQVHRNPMVYAMLGIGAALPRVAALRRRAAKARAS